MDTNERKNYYEVLDIQPNRSGAEIEQAYVRARNAYSNDSVALYSLMTKDECQKYLDQIEEAYSVLGFPEKRREYDRIRGLNPTGYAQGAPVENGSRIQYEDFGSNLIEARVSKVTAQKKFALEFNENPEMERKIRDSNEFTGAYLKEIREYKNVTLERMAELTRISKTIITALEEEELTKLPAEVYVRGNVFQIAKVLKLNPDAVATSYILRFKKLKAQK
jgi:DnaJ-class molecular chaperone